MTATISMPPKASSGQSGSSGNVELRSSQALTETDQIPNLPGLVRARSATGLLVAVNPDIYQMHEEDGKLTFSGILTYGEIGGVFPLCDGDKASEPAFGICTGVFLQTSNLSHGAFVTASHCLRGIVDASVPTFALFDYNRDRFSLEQRVLTTEMYARVDRETIELHPFLDIGWTKLDFGERSPLVPISTAAGRRPDYWEAGWVVRAPSWPSEEGNLRFTGNRCLDQRTRIRGTC